MSEESTGVGEQSSPEQSIPQEAESQVQEGVQESSEIPESQGLSSEQVEEIQNAIDNGASKKEVQNMIKRFKIKVDGKELEKEVNLADEEFLRNQLQLAEVSKKRMQEAAEMKKILNIVEQQLRQDPWSVMQQLGLDPDELAEMRIQQRIEEMKKSPEQLERERIQRELEQARLEAKRLKEEKEAIEFAKLQEEAAIQIENEITRALDAHRTLPKSRHVVKRIADSMLWAMNNGYEDVTAEDVIPLVERDLRDELNRFMEEMPEELLESYIGKKTTERLRAKRLQAMQPKTLSQVKPTSKSVESQESKKEPQKIRARDFFRNLGKN